MVDPDNPEYTPASDRKTVVAGFIVLFYLVVLALLIWTVMSAEDPVHESKWDQVMVLVTAIGTLATGAAGILFGVKIQSVNVDAATERAAKAEHAEKVASARLAVKDSLMGTALGQLAGPDDQDGKNARSSRSVSGEAKAAEDLLRKALEK